MAVLVAAAQPHLARRQARRRRLAVAGPALEQARADQRAALRIADPLPLDRRAGVEQHAVVEPVDHLARRRDGHDMRPRALDRAPAQPRWRPRRARRARPTRAPAAPRRRRSPPPGGRQSTSTTSAPWARTASANDDSPTLTALTRCSTLALASCPISLISPPPSAPRPACTAKRELRLLDGLRFALDGDDAALVAHGDGQLVALRRGDRARAARRRPVRGRRRGGRHQRGRRACHGRPAAGARRHAREPRPRPRRERARRPRVGGRAARRAGRRRPPDARRAGGAVGLLHRQR